MPRKPQVSGPDDTKRLLSALRMTTTVGALSLTLAGWGLLARADALSAQAGQDTPAAFESAAAAAVVPAELPSSVRAGEVASLRSAARSAVAAAQTRASTALGKTRAALDTSRQAVPTATATAPATATPAPEPTATAVARFKLDIVNWVKTTAGDPVAIVRDSRKVLWYVWGPDVERIEQGLSPQYSPMPVDSVTRTRRS